MSKIMKFIFIVIVLIVATVRSPQAVEANGKIAQAVTVCDVEDGPRSFETDHFHINYDSIQGGLTIEDYANALEEIYAFEVDSYGWAAPPLCTASACGGNANPWGKYPVQISGGIDEGVLGYVTGGGEYAGYIIGDNPNTPVVEAFSSSTCMVLSDDYSKFGSNPSEILRETVAHEFFHAIQEGYGDDNAAPESNMWYESSAVYIEDEVVDESINDNQYLWPRVENCLADWPDGAEPEELSAYSNFLLFRYAAEQTGGAYLPGGGEDVIQFMWQNIAAEQPAIVAFDNALRSKGQTLSSLFHTYAIAVKYSRSCGGRYVAPYCFEEGNEYRNSTSSLPQTHGFLADVNEISLNGTIRDDYAINWIVLPTNRRFDLTIENNASGGELQATIACDSGTEIRTTSLSSAPLSSGGAAQINAVDTTGCIESTLVITNQARSDNAAVCSARSYTVTRSALTSPAPNTEAVSLYLPLIAVLN